MKKEIKVGGMEQIWWGNINGNKCQVNYDGPKERDKNPSTQVEDGVHVT